MPLCSRRACRTRANFLLGGAGRRCSICGTRYLQSRSTAGLCGDAICQGVHLAREASAAARESARKRGERRQALRTQVPASLSDLRLPIVVLPGFEGRVRGNGDRHAAFLETVAAEAREAFEQIGAEVPVDDGSQDESGPADGPLATLLAEACALCCGSCCRTGVDHAYLTADALRWIAVENGIRDWQELVGRYQSLIPGLSYEGSCIFHCSDGCALPTAMRSKTCKTYFCAGARQLIEEIRQGSAQVVLLSTNVDEDLETEPAIWSAAVVPFDSPYR